MHILIVDDDPLVALTLTLIFRRNGFEASTAHGADQALASTRLTAPDIVLCDIDMARELPACPILVLTGFYSSLARVRDYANTLLQPISIVTKPCQPGDLLRHAGALLKTA